MTKGLHYDEGADILNKICPICKGKNKTFYEIKDNFLFPDGKFHICSDCLKEEVKNDGMETIYLILQTMNKPFMIDVWEDCEKKDTETFGGYIRRTNNKQYQNKTWKDSYFSIDENGEQETTVPQKEEEIPHELIEKWGKGYSLDEYLEFDKKYKFILSDYPIKSAMHDEALKKYCRYTVKEEFAIASGDVAKAKQFADLAQKQAEHAKINPRQFSKEDYSDGVDCFSEFAREVEKAVDIVEIMPQFKARPQDSVDFNIWAYVNYVRDMIGKPLASYQEVYNFLEQRKKEYEETLKLEMVEDEN